jgi:hypothetical protein
MRRVRVKVLTTNNLQVSGVLTIPMPQDSYRSKLSDLLNNSRSFIAMTEVEIYGKDEQLLAKMPFLCINKPAIAFVFEDESTKGLAEKADNSEALPAPHPFLEKVCTSSFLGCLSFTA